MRTADIKVGGHYAYESYKRGAREHVRVDEVSVPRNEGWGYSKKSVKNGVRVTFIDKQGNDSKTAVVASRSIVQTWEEQAEANRLAAEHRAAAAAERERTAARRANLAKRIDAVLEAHGVPVVTYLPTFYRSEDEAAIRAAGYEFRDTTYGRRDGAVTRIIGLDDLMRSGDVDERTVEVLLADASIAAGVQ